MFVGVAYGQSNHFVRAGAGGTDSGADWTNAFPTLPATLTRNDTYYVADGIYVQYTFDDPVSGTQTITIKKATIADHGTETGWFDTYGDGQAAWEVPDTGNTEPDNTAWWVTTNYWIFDGQVGGGNQDWDGTTNPHGFLLTVDQEGNFVFDPFNTNMIRLGEDDTGSSVDFIEIRHVEFYLGNETQDWGTEVDYNIFGINASLNWVNVVGTDDGCFNVTVSECYFNELHVNIHNTSGHNWLIENSFFWKNHDNDDGGSRQENGMKQYAPHDSTVRYCLFYNQNGTGSITLSCGNQNVTANFPDKNVDNMQVHGNIFYNDDTLGNDVGEICVTLEHVSAGEPNGVIAGLFVINNSFYDNFGVNTTSGIRTEQDEEAAGGQDDPLHGHPAISNFVVKNNIHYDCDSGRSYLQFFNNITDLDYNWIYLCDDGRTSQGEAGTNRDTELVALMTNGIEGTSDPFTSPATLDFGLTAAIAGDATVGATYNTDMFGNTRGDDGTWDMGAIELDESVAVSTAADRRDTRPRRRYSGQ